MAEAPTIDFAKPEDREAVVDLFAADLGDLRLPVDRPGLGDVFDALVQDPRAVLLVVRGGDGVAQGVLVANRVPSVKFSGWSMWIEELFVGHNARQQGLGRRLVTKLLDVARQEGVRGIDLEAYHGNAPAALLYRNLGFRRLGRERFYYRFEWDHESDGDA
jgi:GNAT superfamily N-acetyltransferase